jgi:hypothetical protein
MKDLKQSAFAAGTIIGFTLFIGGIALGGFAPMFLPNTWSVIITLAILLIVTWQLANIWVKESPDYIGDSKFFIRLMLTLGVLGYCSFGIVVLILNKIW